MLIRRGEVVGVPTDTFYGLAADPFNLAAVARIYEIKGRPERRALPILVTTMEQCSEFVADLPDAFFKLAERFWPGALTIVVEASSRVPFKVTGGPRSSLTAGSPKPCSLPRWWICAATPGASSARAPSAKPTSAKSSAASFF